MFEIKKHKILSPGISLYEVYAPRVANTAEPGQFVIVRIHEKGERIPLTICDYNREAGTVSIVVQAVGRSTFQMVKLEKGDNFLDFAGPLGQPSELIEESDEELKNKKILFIGGGVGAAPVYPQIKWLSDKGIKADMILGARSKEQLILKEDIKKTTNNLWLCTNDGSKGETGFVTDVMRRLKQSNEMNYDLIVVIGPMIMMKSVSELSLEYGIKTIASLNTLMVDGTGMCGACRVTVGNETKFTCVDGPEFNAHLVDFNEAMRRQMIFKTEEGKDLLKTQKETEEHNCSCQQA